VTDWSVVEGDGPAALAAMEPGSIGAIVTDPPWPNGGERLFGVDPDALFARFCAEVERVTGRLVVVLGSLSDPRILRHVPTGLPYLRQCELRYFHAMRIGGFNLNDADIAHCFGRFRPTPPRRFLGTACLVIRGRDPSTRHPTPRRVEHMAWVVDHYTEPGSLVVDPFCGSGTTGAACLRMGRRFFGIDVNPEHVAEARERLALEAAHSSAKVAATGPRGLFA
jgi:hypothetical protein